MKYEYIVSVLVYDVVDGVVNTLPRTEYIRVRFTHRPSEFEIWSDVESFLHRNVEGIKDGSEVIIIDGFFEKMTNRFSGNFIDNGNF